MQAEFAAKVEAEFARIVDAVVRREKRGMRGAPFPGSSTATVTAHGAGTSSRTATTGRGTRGIVMGREEVLGLLRMHKKTLVQRFGMVEVKLYGSFARNQVEDDSDVDILVRFDVPPDWRRYFRSAGLPRGPAGATRGHGD